MKNRNIAIGVGVIILLWWLSRKKDTVDTMVDEVGGGGGGGIGGGGFFPSFPIPPMGGGTGTGTTTSGTGANVLKGEKSTTPDSGGVRNPVEDAKPQDVVLAPEFTYTTGFALRPLRIKLANSNTYRTFTVGSRIEIAQPKLGNNYTHPKINPAQTLLLGTDVDFQGINTGGTTTGGLGIGLGGGGIADVTPTGGATGGTISGGTISTGSTTPRVGAIGTKLGSTTAGKAPSGTL